MKDIFTFCELPFSCLRVYPLSFMSPPGGGAKYQTCR